MSSQRRLSGRDLKGMVLVLVVLFGSLTLAQLCLRQVIRPEVVLIGGLVVATIFCYFLRKLASGGFFKGLELYRRCQFEDALRYFQTSYVFFGKHTNLDRFRSVLFWTPIRPRLRILALNYQAFCYSQLNQGAKAAELYQKATREDPNFVVPELMHRALRSFTTEGDPEER